MKGIIWIWLPPRRFAPPLLFQEGAGISNQDHYAPARFLALSPYACYAQSVRRLAATSLIAVYTFLLLWNSVDRTNSWAAQQSESIAHRSALGHSSEIGKLRLSDSPRSKQSRIIEATFAIQPGMQVIGITFRTRVLSQSSAPRITGPDVREFSSRAPPLSA